MKKQILILAAYLLVNNAFATQEIVDSNITNDLAKTILNNAEPEIRYNPEYCKTVGEKICNFFLSHEYGHISLGHKLGGTFTAAEEYAADCWVAQNAPEDLSKAAYSYFTNEGNMGSWTHGSGKQRAENLSECAVVNTFEKIAIEDNSNRTLIQAKSIVKHVWDDKVFADIEKWYPGFFPKSGAFTYEYFTAGKVYYYKKYYNGSLLAEENGKLYYILLGGKVNLWGPIANWRI